MTILFSETFEGLATGGQSLVDAGYTVDNILKTMVDTTNVYDGSHNLMCKGIGVYTVSFPFTSSSANLNVSFRIYSPDITPSFNSSYPFFNSHQGYKLHLYNSSGSKLRAYNGSTLIQSSTLNFPHDYANHFIEIANNNDTVIVTVDGTEYLNFSYSLSTPSSVLFASIRHSDDDSSYSNWTYYDNILVTTNDTTVTPDTKIVTITKYVPTVIASNNITVTPDTKTVTITKYVPIITITGEVPEGIISDFYPSRPPINFTRGVIYYNEISNSLLYPAPSSLNSSNYVSNQGSNVICFTKSVLETEVPSLKKRILYDRILIKSTSSASDDAEIGTVAYCSINQIDLSMKDALVLYIRASRGTLVGDLALILDNSNTFNSILETLYIPSLVINVWHRVLLRLNNPYDDTAINTIGIQLLNNLGTFNLDIAEVRGLKELNGARSFAIDDNVDELEESDYQSKHNREYTHSNYFWTATIEGHKEEKPPFTMRTKYVFAFSESNAIGDAFVGEGNYSGFDVVGRMDDLVRYNYKLQGTLPIFFPQKNAIILQAPEPVL